MELMDYFKTIILISLFYSVCITSISRTIPSDALRFVSSFNTGGNFDVEIVQAKIEQGVKQQTTLPIIDVGALVFYSGNIFLDLLLNFVFALPQLITMVIAGVGFLVSFDKELIVMVQTFLTAIISIMYFIGLIQMLLNIRSGGRVVG